MSAISAHGGTALPPSWKCPTQAWDCLPYGRQGEGHGGQHGNELMEMSSWNELMEMIYIVFGPWEITHYRFIQQNSQNNRNKRREMSAPFSAAEGGAHGRPNG